MKRSKEIEQILDACLERIFAGETVEACLRDYPQHAEELEPLLEMVTGAIEAVDIKPRPEFREQAARDFQSAVRDMRPVRAGSFFGLHRLATAVLSVVVVVLLAGGGTVAASGGSLPDSPLYTVKLATESVRISLAFSDESKTELYAKFANNRVDEIVAMAEAGNIDAVNKATDKLNGQLVAMADIYRAEDNQHTVMTMGDASATGGQEERALMVPAPSSGTEELDKEPIPQSTSTIKPVPTITVAAPDESLAATSQEKSLLGAKGPGYAYGEDTDENLRDSIIADAASNSIKLEQAKEETTDSLREALQRAIEIAMYGYGVAISYIE